MLDDLFCGFEGVDGATPSFGDVNHDGLPDILAGGHGESHEITTWLYLNRGDFCFKPCGGWYDTASPWTFNRISHGNNHLIDFDNDGYLDAWNMGWAHSDVCSRECATELYRNTSSDAGAVPNEAPTAPQNLKAVYDQATKMVTFSWDAASDDVTPQEALQYNLYLKKSGSDKFFMTVPADVQTGFIKTGEISGQISTTVYSMYIDDEEATYEWGVQAIDNGKRGGAFTLSRFDPSGSSVEEYMLPGVRIYGANGKLHYHVNESTTLTVMDETGTTISHMTVDDSGTIDIPRCGVYLIKADIGHKTQTFKVVL